MQRVLRAGVSRPCPGEHYASATGARCISSVCGAAAQAFAYEGGARLWTDAIGASFVCFLQDWSYEAVRRLLALH